jgi:hypothetical protein
MDAERTSYYVCGSCLGERHEDCAGIYETGSCACGCTYALEGTSRQIPLAPPSSTD